MTNLDTGYTGAKVQSWNRANPRDLLKKLLEAHGDRDDKDKMLKLFYEKLEEADKAYTDAIVEYWFTNNYNSLTAERVIRDPASRAARQKTETAVAGQMKSELREKIIGAANLMLLALVLPNGKKLADCTGRECRALSKKTGSWLKKIADKIKPDERVGDRLSEADVRKLYGKR
jgi:hypothetical protein